MFSKIILNSAWYFVVLSIILSLGLSLFLYYKNKKNKELSTGVLYTLFSLRFFSVFLILLFLLNIFLKQITNETEQPIILFAFDNSASVNSGIDSTYIKKQLPEELEQLKKDLQKNYEIRSLLFGANCESSDKAPDFSEKETDLSNVFQNIDNNYSNQNIGALILISDGIYNKGANPLYASEKQNYPIYTLALGDTSELRDLAIQKVNHNQITYAGNNFPVDVIINAKKFTGQTVKVSLFEQNVLKAQQNIHIPSSSFLSTVSFTLSAATTGLNRYTAKIDVLDEEKNKENNEQSFAIEVIDSKERILLMANSPHPDIAALHDALTNSTNYEVEFFLGKEPAKSLSSYNLVIFHGYVPAQAALVSQCVKYMVPYWIINPAVSEGLPDIKINGGSGRFNEAEPIPVNAFSLFNTSPELKKFIPELPALKTFFGNYTLNNGAQSLIKQRIGIVETENPILTFSESGTVKSALFIGDGLWRWKLRDYAEHKNTTLFNELISKSVQYLTVKADKSLFRVNAPKIIEENKIIEFDAEVYNKSYEAITDPEVSMLVRNEDKKQFNYTFSKTDKSYKLSIGSLPVGKYIYDAEVKINNELFKKQGSFIVKEIMSEKINTVANHQLLYQLSNRSKGKFFYPKQIKNLEEELLKNENIKAITYSKKSTTSLIELAWLFWLILIFLSAEWFFRKRYLSI